MHSLAHLLIICACAILCQLLESLEMSGRAKQPRPKVNSWHDLHFFIFQILEKEY